MSPIKNSRPPDGSAADCLRHDSVRHVSHVGHGNRGGAGGDRGQVPVGAVVAESFGGQGGGVAVRVVSECCCRAPCGAEVGTGDRVRPGNRVGGGETASRRSIFGRLSLLRSGRSTGPRLRTSWVTPTRPPSRTTYRRKYLRSTTGSFWTT